jgi:mono/diheme cytochrome c family protein
MRSFVFGLLLGTLVVPIAALIVCLAGCVPATSHPPRREMFLARRALAASVARRATRLRNPVEPNSGNLRAGLQVYRDNCSGCHGDAGKPSHWGTTAFYPRAPQFDIQPPLMPEGQIFWVVKHDVRYTDGRLGGRAFGGPYVESRQLPEPLEKPPA